MQNLHEQAKGSINEPSVASNQGVEARDQIDGAKDDLRALIGAADMMEESDMEFTNPKQGFRAVQVLAQAALDKLTGASGMLEEQAAAQQAVGRGVGPQALDVEAKARSLLPAARLDPEMVEETASAAIARLQGAALMAQLVSNQEPGAEDGLHAILEDVTAKLERLNTTAMQSDERRSLAVAGRPHPAG